MKGRLSWRRAWEPSAGIQLSDTCGRAGQESKTQTVRLQVISMKGSSRPVETLSCQLPIQGIWRLSGGNSMSIPELAGKTGYPLKGVINSERTELEPSLSYGFHKGYSVMHFHGCQSLYILNKNSKVSQIMWSSLESIMIIICVFYVWLTLFIYIALYTQRLQQQRPCHLLPLT